MHGIPGTAPVDWLAASDVVVAQERLQKLLTRGGYGSRRSCETIIRKGRVRVDGEIATLGDSADPNINRIEVDGKLLVIPESFEYIMLHKPRGVISDEDVGDQYTAARELIPLEGHLFPVGRLDVQSEGLLLFTSDGELAHKLTHPSYDHTRRYEVLVEGKPTQAALERWRMGVKLGKGKTRPAGVEVIRRDKDGGTWLSVTLKEGKKRQIRRVAASLGYPVHRLIRTGMGPLELSDLPPGAWRQLTDEEVTQLRTVRLSQRRGARPVRKKTTTPKNKRRSSHNRRT